MTKTGFICFRCGDPILEGRIQPPRPGWALPVSICASCLHILDQFDTAVDSLAWTEMTIHQLKRWCVITGDEHEGNAKPLFNAASKELTRRGYTYDEKSAVWLDQNRSFTGRSE